VQTGKCTRKVVKMSKDISNRKSVARTVKRDGNLVARSLKRFRIRRCSYLCTVPTKCCLKLALSFPIGVSDSNVLRKIHIYSVQSVNKYFFSKLSHFPHSVCASFSHKDEQKYICCARQFCVCVCVCMCVTLKY